MLAGRRYAVNRAGTSEWQDSFTPMGASKSFLGDEHMNTRAIGAALAALPLLYGSWVAAEGRELRRDFSTEINAIRQVQEGRNTFRYATFGDEAFWGDGLGLHLAIAGAANGGVGPGVSPTAALGVGLKVDVNSLPR